MKDRFWLIWQDEGLTPEIVRGPFESSEELDASAKAFVQSEAWNGHEDGLYYLIIDSNGQALIDGFSNVEIEEWSK